jgi:hypothetical protein
MATPAVATPQPKTVKPSKPKKSASKPNQTNQTKQDSQLKQKQAAMAELKRLLDEDAKLYGKSVKAILEYAQNILKARDELKGNGIPELNFDPWKLFQEKCKGKSHVSKYLTIAEHSGINNPKNLMHLPASFTSLYTLAATMSAEELNDAMKTGKLNPKTTRDDARALTGRPPQTPVSKKRQLAKANDEDHMDAAEKLDAAQDEHEDNTAHTAAHAAVLYTKPLCSLIHFAQDDTETTAPLTFIDPLEDDAFFKWDLTATKDPYIEVTPSIHNRLLAVLGKLKSELPTIPGYVWHIALRPATDLALADTLVA